MDEILQYVENEPPEIVLENLGLVKNLFSNCRSHIFLKTEQPREDQENILPPKGTFCEKKILAYHDFIKDL